MKSSFTVGFVLGDKRHVVYGVTSIVPNMNGVLFFTENRENFQVESHQMTSGNILGNMYIEYSTSEDFEDHESLKEASPEKYEIHDMRN